MSGTDFSWAYLGQHLPGFLNGLKLTLVFAIVCNALAILFGYAGAVVLLFRVPVLRHLTRFVVSFVRNTPLLVQLFFFYFGLPEIGLRTDPVTSGIIVLTLWAAAYQIENIRGAIAGLPGGIVEAGTALGLRQPHLFVFVIAPLATRAVVPAMMNTAVSTTKNSALLSAIGAAELTYVAMNNIADDYRGPENFVALFVGYITVVLALSGVATLVERRLGRGFRA